MYMAFSSRVTVIKFRTAVDGNSTHSLCTCMNIFLGRCPLDSLHAEAVLSGAKGY